MAPSDPPDGPDDASRDGRVAMLGGLAALADAIPLPFLPDRLIAQVRGSVVQEIASRHGLVLVTDARAHLARASAEKDAKALRRALDFLVRRVLRRVGLGPIGPALRGFDVYALGILFDRYLRTERTADGPRIYTDEARSARALIDRAIALFLSPSFRPNHDSVLDETEDLRDAWTRRLDTLLLAGASLPAYLRARLEAAFDEERARPTLS
jgi:hypothetical protein